MESTKQQTPKITNKLMVNCALFHSFTLFFSICLPFLSTSAFAALSTFTSNTVIGSAPYFTFDETGTKVQSVDDFFTLSLSDGRKYSKSDNPSSHNQPIELPESGQSFENITMFIPKTLSTITFNDLVHAPYNRWGDDNADGMGDTGVSANGTISLTITNVRNEPVDRSEKLSACSAPYKVTISNTAGNLTTEYGDPKKFSFEPASETYYFKPKKSAPFPCWAQPNIEFSKGHIPIGYPQEWGDNYDGPASEWLPNRGFLPQSINNPSQNFPTTGGHGLFFNFTVGDAFGRSISYSKTPASSGISLQITDGGDNRAKVMLIGPRHGASKESAATAVPTTFTLYSDASKTQKIYSFTISKWFISIPTNSEYIANYCSNSYGENYRYPHINELTNANEPAYNWNSGLANQPNFYQRRIGGGLFSEWGNISASIDENRYYKESDFAWRRYWVDLPFGNNRINVGSDYGYLHDEPGHYIQGDIVCVTPK